MTSVASAITGSGSRDAADAQAAAAAQAGVTSMAAMSQQIKALKEEASLQFAMLDKVLAVGEPFRESGTNALSMYESFIYGIPQEQTVAYRAGEIAKIEADRKSKEQIATELYSQFWADGNGDGWGGILEEPYRKAIDETYDKQEADIARKIADLDDRIAETEGQTVDPMDIVKATPGYQFRMDEGYKALDRSAAARSGILSGAQTKAAQRYGQDYATNEFQNYLNRLTPLIQTGAAAAGAQQQGILNTAGTQAGLTGRHTSALGQGYGNYGSAQMQIGSARASGYLGQQAIGTNLLNNAFGFAGQYYGGVQ